MGQVFQPNAEVGTPTTNSKTLSGSNTIVNVALFSITGTVRIYKLYGIVTTTIGTNHTGGYFRLNDQTTQVNITNSVAATALSNAAVGTIIAKTGLVSAVAQVSTSAAGRVIEPTTLETVVGSEFWIQKKNGATTQIEYTYTTTEQPTSGVIQFFVEWDAVSADGNVTAL